MGNEFAGQTTHSAEYFGDTRDDWYTDDFLALIAARWGLARVRSVLDVGCGAGHWGRVLARVLAPEARVTGIDREPTWVAVAAERARAAGYGARFSFQAGVAAAPPFPDDTFDLVTCQTVLIHCPDPAAVIAEMLRVTRPGGLVAVAEPNNVAGPLIDPSAVLLPVETVLGLVRLQLLCERGKTALGEGNISVGELVPGMFTRAGLVDVDVFQNDRVASLLPPYTSPRERALVDELGSCAEREMWMWSRVDTERYYRAGGGDPAGFEPLWELAGARARACLTAIRAGEHASPGGSVMYLVSGRKPG
jgi:SAM-dependent methyltransferase